MLPDLIDSVHLRLTEELAKTQGLDLSLRYSTKWRSRVENLDKQSEIADFFRQMLLVTQQVNQELSIDQHTRRALRKILLDAFLANKGKKPAAQPAPAAARRRAPRPAPAVPRRPTPTPAAMEGIDEKPHTAQHYIFLGLLEELCRLFDTRVQAEGRLKRRILGQISTLEVGPQSRRTLQKWTTSRTFSENFDMFPVDHMRLVLDMIYTLVCQEFGPVSADSLFAAASESTGRLKEASVFSPTDLL